jgi:rubrerythrin
MNEPIRTLGEFYAHALAIEREAADRYAEFETWFADRGEDVLAGLCRNLGELERSHLHKVERACHGMALQPIDASRYRWIEAGSPEAPARELFYRVAEPRHLLEIALQAECDALAFFEWAGRTSDDAAVRGLAREMAADEEEHVRWMAGALEYRPARHVDWERILR